MVVGPGVDSNDATKRPCSLVSTGTCHKRDDATTITRFTNLYINFQIYRTDDHVEPTQSKSAFHLPPVHIAHEAIPGQPNKVLRKSQEWRWLDPHWRLKLGSDSDVDGWEYANNHWQKWSGKNRRGTYTRRRAWERTAKLIDQREVVLLKDIEGELGTQQLQSDEEEEVEVEEIEVVEEEEDEDQE